MKKYYSGVFTVTRHLFIKLADEGFLKFTGLDMNESVKKVFTNESLSVIENAFKCASSGDYSVILDLRRNDGIYCAFLATFHLFDEDEEKLLEISVNDLSELRESRNELKAYRRTAETYLDIIGAVLIDYERSTDVLEIFYINDSRKRSIFKGTLSGWKNELLKKNIPEESAQEFKMLCGDLASAKKNFRHSIVINGLLSPLDCEQCTFSCRYLNGEDGNEEVAGCIDIGGDKMQKLVIDPVNDKDAFLNMLNKRAVIEQANRIIADQSVKCSFFVLLDLDNFKTVNDVHGHIVGDEVLISATKIINDNLSGRGIVGRMGGDEILIVTETIESQAELRNMLRSIRTTIEWTFKNDPRKLNVTCSMGVSAYPDNEKNFDKLYSLADKMLYIAKSKGKNRYVIYTPNLHDSQLIPETTANGEKNISFDKVGIMQRLIDDYLVRRSYSNEMIFSEIGSAFTLDEILIIYENFTAAFQWTPDGVYSDIESILHFRPNKAFSELFNRDNLIILDGLYKLDGRSPMVEKCLEKKGVKSAMFYRIERAGKFSGYVMFARSTQRQMWSENEIMALSIVAKIFDISMLN